MLNARENFLETIRPDGAPDRLVNQWEAVAPFMPEPLSRRQYPIDRTIGGRIEIGSRGAYDDWGALYIWPEGQPNFAPHPVGDDIVLKDIENWKDTLKIPRYDIENSEWDGLRAEMGEVDRSKKIVTLVYATGLFERLHRIMGFEAALTGMIEYPDAYLELCEAISDQRMHHLEQMVEGARPEMMLIHDDWGMKNSLFMRPKHWRKFIKPFYAKMYAYLHSEGIIIMHHADSFLEPIVEDMAEIGIDIWQGTLPQNDIVKVQLQLSGKMCLQGGIDAPLIDRVDSTEEDVREETLRACRQYGPGGHFIPSITYGGVGHVIYPHVDPAITRAIDEYNREVYGHSS
jgi:hypothetical protein